MSDWFEYALSELAVGEKHTDVLCQGLTARRLRSGIVLEWRGRVGAEKVSLRLGRWPQLTVARARTLVERARTVARSGGDPRGRRPSGPTTTAAAIKRYEREHLAFKRTGNKTARLLRRYLEGVAGWPLEAVGRAELVSRHVDRGRRRTRPAPSFGPSSGGPRPRS